MEKSCSPEGLGVAVGPKEARVASWVVVLTS